MASKRVARKIDKLVTRVFQVDLVDCQSYEQFVTGLAHIMHNMELLLEAFAACRPADSRARRAVDDLKLKAMRLLRLCRSAPTKVEHPDEWRQVARHIVANYEMLRIDAGRVYALLVPDSPIGVLRSAL